MQPLSAPLQNGIRFLPPPLPAAPSAHLAVRFPSSPLAYGAGRTTGLPRSADVPQWQRPHLYAGGSPSAPQEFGACGPGHAPFGPSGSAACACSYVTTPTMLYLGWPYHCILVPDHLAAGSRSYGSRLGCPPCGGGYVVPGLIIPVGYCWQNSRCYRRKSFAVAQLHRRHRVAPERHSSAGGRKCQHRQLQKHTFKHTTPGRCLKRFVRV